MCSSAQNLGFRAWGLGLGLGLRVMCLGFGGYEGLCSVDGVLKVVLQ